jgi:hypothetical protein
MGEKLSGPMNAPAETARCMVAQCTGLVCVGRLERVCGQLLRISPSPLCFEKKELKTGIIILTISSRILQWNRGYVLSLLDHVWLQRWQLLEFTSLAMGHLQRRS